VILLLFSALSLNNEHMRMPRCAQKIARCRD